MLNCVEEIEKTRNVKRTSKKIITYSFLDLYSILNQGYFSKA